MRRVDICQLAEARFQAPGLALSGGAENGGAEVVTLSGLPDWALTRHLTWPCLLSQLLNHQLELCIYE